MGIKKIYETIRDFLFSNVNKQFLIFLFFLLLSGISWLILTLNETYEYELKVPIRLANVPKNIVITSAETDTMRVGVRDKGWQLVNYIFGDKLKLLRVSFKNYERGNGKGVVSASDIRRIVEQQLEISSRVTSVTPDKLEFFYNSGERKRIPVRWTGRVVPEELYYISRTVYEPDSVDVYATVEKLDSISVVYTERLNYTAFRDTLHVECRLSHPKDVKVVPERIKIGFYTDVLTEEVIDGVPIRSINVPEGQVLRTFPAKVKVHIVAGASQLRGLHPEDFVVIADFREIQQSHSEKCNIYLRSVPHGITRATLDSKQVDYLIEEE